MRDQKTFEEHLDEIRDTEESDENPLEKRINRLDKLSEDPDNQSLYSYSLPIRIVFGVVVFILSLLLASAVSPNPGIFLFLLSAPLFIFMSTASKSGVAMRREFMKIMEESMEEAQQQQQDGTTQSQTDKVVCQSCGWKNPKANNFCHDCGNEL